MFRTIVATSLLTVLATCALSIDVLADGGTWFIAQGRRIDLSSRGFSIVAPSGWEVNTSHPELSILMQIPESPSLPYQRTLQVMSFDGPRYIDDHTAKDFSLLIARKFSENSNSVRDYQIRSHTFVETSSGRPAILFYADFMLENLSLMHAHLMISSLSRHYLVTYTDISENFEGDGSVLVTEAWDSMISIEAQGATPQRGLVPTVFVTIFGVLLFILLTFLLVRRYRAGKNYQEALDELPNFPDTKLPPPPPRHTPPPPKQTQLPPPPPPPHDGQVSLDLGTEPVSSEVEINLDDEEAS